MFLCMYVCIKSLQNDSIGERNIYHILHNKDNNNKTTESYWNISVDAAMHYNIYEHIILLNTVTYFIHSILAHYIVVCFKLFHSARGAVYPY